MSDKSWHGPLDRLDDCRWRIPRTYKDGMRTDGIIYADDAMIEQVKGDQAPEQVANVAFLPGIAGPTSIGAMASPSAAAPPPTRNRGA